MQERAMKAHTRSKHTFVLILSACVIAAGVAFAQPGDAGPAESPARAALESALAAERAFDYESAATHYLVALALDPLAPGAKDGLARVAGKRKADGALLADVSLREALAREKQRADTLEDQVRALEQSLRAERSRIDSLERDLRQSVPQAEPFGQRLDREIADLRRMLSSIERETSRLGREIDRIWSRIR